MAENVNGGQKNVETDHEYDGIKEFDNPMPRWWLLTFYGAIVFAVFYWGYYHTSGAGMSQMEAYAATMEEAEAQMAAQMEAISEEDLMALASNQEMVAKGSEIFTANCVACHAQGGVGLVGPNLTDGYWIHGSGAREVFGVVSEGILAKGMPAWKPVLGPSNVQAVTAYVLSLKDTNVPGKAPEGVNAAGEPAPAAN